MREHHEWKMTGEGFNKPSAVQKEMLRFRGTSLVILDEIGGKPITMEPRFELLPPVQKELIRLKEVPFESLVEALNRAEGFDFQRVEEKK